jgi:tRNA pseudouridine55 synthase
MAGGAAPIGVLLIDKPGGLTSHDVVSRTRRALNTRKVGHAGTLDPMATGLLVLGVGGATRLLTYIVGLDKTYETTIVLGASTDTDDADGTVVERADTARLAAVTNEEIRAGIADLTGDIEQVPSTVSAIKVDGQRAYKRVREGEAVELPARPVTVSRFAATRFDRSSPDLLDVDVEVECTSGTYVRALARDLGAAVGVGGHLTALRRTRVGPFGLDLARTLDELATRDDPVTVPLPEAVRMAMPVREIDADEARELSFGRALAVRGIAGVHAAITPDGVVAALLREDDGRARPVLVFAAAV